jgi:hypothetical protein
VQIAAQGGVERRVVRLRRFRCRQRMRGSAAGGDSREVDRKMCWIQGCVVADLARSSSGTSAGVAGAARDSAGA